MPEIVRLATRMDCSVGLNLVAAPDRQPPGSFLQLTNARVVEEGRIEGRPGNTVYGNPVPAPKLLHSIRRLNDPDESFTANGYTYIVGNGTTLDAGPETDLVEIDTGYSGNPLSILTFRPDQSPESWAYVYDQNKQTKVRPDGVTRAIGVAPPNAAPNADYGIPAWLEVNSGQATGSWTGTPTLFDRTNGDAPTITNILYNSGTTGWCCIQASVTQFFWMASRMQVVLNSGQPNAETVVVRDVIPGVGACYINAIQYDSGATGLCSIVLSTASSGPAMVPAGAARNSIIQIIGGGGTELVRILSVVLSPDGSTYSIRVNCANNHAAGATVNGELSWYAYTAQNHITGETITSNALSFPLSVAGTGAATLTGALNLSTANGRPIDPANDYMCISVFLQNPQNVVNFQILISLDSTPNFSFSSPGNSYIWTVTQADLIDAGASGEGGSYSGGGDSWATLVLPISQAQRSGGADALTLLNTSGIALQLTTTGACAWGFDWWYLFGTYGPVIQPNSPTGYVYDSTFRDSSTGATSVPGPTTRYELFPLREAVVITPATTTAPGVDYSDIYREGGTLTDFVYIGSVQNNNALPNSYTDGLSDETIASNPGVDLTQLQPWPTLALPLSGIVNVVGSSVVWVSGNQFPTALVSNTVILLNGIAYETRGQPHTALYLELELDAGVLVNAAYSIASPTLAGQPLAFAFGPLEGPFAPVAFALGDPVNGGTLYFSNTSNLDSASDQNSIELCGPTEPLVCGEVWNGLVFAGSRENVYLTRYAFLQSTGSAPYQYSRLPSGTGFWSRWTICRGPDGIYALGRDGIYKFSEQGGVNITDAQLYPLFPHDGQPAQAVNGYNPVDMTQINFMRLSYLDQQLSFIYLDTSGTQMEMRFEISRGRWFVHQYGDPLSLRYLNEPSVSNPNNLSILELSRTLGLIYQAGGNTDNGVAITTVVQLPYLDGGDERAQKLPTDWIVDADGTGTLTASQNYNNGIVSGPTSALVLTGPRGQSIINISAVPNPLALYRNISALFSWTGGPSGPRIYAAEPAFYIQPFLSTRVMTQFIGLAFPGWKTGRRAYPALISTGPTTLTTTCQDGRQFQIKIPSTNGRFLIQPIMQPQCIKALAMAFQVDTADGSPFALFDEDFVVEYKEWSEPSFVKIAVFRT